MGVTYHIALKCSQLLSSFQLEVRGGLSDPQKMTVLLAGTTDFMVWPKDSGVVGGGGEREVWLHHHAEGRLSGAEPSPSHFADEETEAKEPRPSTS